MKHILILLVIILSSCTLGKNYSKLIEGHWEITSVKINNVEAFDKYNTTSEYNFISTGFNQGDLERFRIDHKQNAKTEYSEQFNILNDGEVYIQINKSLSKVHDIIEISENYLKISYSFEGTEYTEVLERIE